LVPTLHSSRLGDEHSPDDAEAPTTEVQPPTTSRMVSIRTSVVAYVKHRDFLPSFALSLLYLTVLSFGGQMVTYLLAAGFTAAHISLMRTVAVVFEMSATWLAPRAMTRAGPVRAGLWFVIWQAASLAAAVSWFSGSRTGSLPAALGLVIGVVASRVGLWGFDLCVQLIIQEVCSVFSGLEPRSLP
jgi:solute carrier family 40 (iron-regulated transporter), member 1